MTQQVLAKEFPLYVAERIPPTGLHRVCSQSHTQQYSAVNSVKNSVKLCGKLFLLQQMQVI